MTDLIEQGRQFMNNRSMKRRSPSSPIHRVRSMRSQDGHDSAVDFQSDHGLLLPT
ncbi:hypothetical protein PMG71_01945 [Roseofilum sp. BLCC_M154]|uniref:Uncharacterized protein n=1 Tax=Roseofilum acuticapitatum BLCC-M154 TaxID=3022444 RepID=A0ABT7ANL3_9CYAN|nr:hypothetical protein [Roseofilum acuticapitatum]MDJ1168187.1 hypothetical protein [Roseofilum acuticapitatum BLCC-M154]